MEVTLCRAASFICMYVKEWVHRVQRGLKEESCSDSQQTNGLRRTDCESVVASLQPRRFEEDAAGGGKFNIWQIYSQRLIKEYLPRSRDDRSGKKNTTWETETDQPVNSHHHPANKSGFSYTSWKKSNGIIAHLACFCKIFNLELCSIV